MIMPKVVGIGALDHDCVEPVVECSADISSCPVSVFHRERQKGAQRGGGGGGEERKRGWGAGL